MSVKRLEDMISSDVPPPPASAYTSVATAASAPPPVLAPPPPPPPPATSPAPPAPPAPAAPPATAATPMPTPSSAPPTGDVVAVDSTTGTVSFNMRSLFAAPAPGPHTPTQPPQVSSYEDNCDDTPSIADAQDAEADDEEDLFAASVPHQPTSTIPTLANMEPKPAAPPVVHSGPSIVGSKAIPSPCGAVFVAANPSDSNMTRLAMVMGRVEDEFRMFADACGLLVLVDPSKRRPDVAIHQAMYVLQWEPHMLRDMDVAHLLSMEVSLSAMQLYVQAMENHWTARHNTLNTEFARIIVTRRRQHARTAHGEAVDSKGEQEALLVESSPDIAKLCMEVDIAKEMSIRLRDMGSRYAQLEDGLKRTITSRMQRG